jgi:hypothetical protein
VHMRATHCIYRLSMQVAAAVKTAEAAARAEADADAGYCPVPAPSASATTSSSASLSLRTGSLQRASVALSSSASGGADRSAARPTASAPAGDERPISSTRSTSALFLSTASSVGTTLWRAKDTTEQAATLLASTAGVTSLQRMLLDFTRRYLPGLLEEKEEQQRKRTQRTRQARWRMNATLRECGAAMDRAEAAQAMAIALLSLRLSHPPAPTTKPLPCCETLRLNPIFCCLEHINPAMAARECQEAADDTK